MRQQGPGTVVVLSSRHVQFIGNNKTYHGISFQLLLGIKKDTSTATKKQRGFFVNLLSSNYLK